ncbi:MAG: tyrosine-type recombinase/integrase [Treponema sp.]|nr:tyrosine-type recombinase/integrase [Treponema sp.]
MNLLRGWEGGIMPQGKNKSAAGAGTIRKKTVTQKGKTYTYWEARFTVEYDPVTGKQKQRAVTGKTQKEVAQKLREITAEIDRGTYVEPSKLTLAQWLERWQAEYLVGVKPSTANLYKECIRLYILPHLGDARLDKLTGAKIQHFYNGLNHPSKEGQKAICAKSVKNVHGILHKALQQAVKNGTLRLNPTESCVLPRVVKKEIYPLTKGQMSALFQLLPGHPHEYLYQIALFTGMREGELLGLPWSCIDFEHNLITVKQQLQREHKTGGAYALVPPKNGKKRYIPMAASVAKLFALQKQKQDSQRKEMGELWEDTGLVFTNPTGGYLSSRTVYDCFKRLVKKIGAPNARVHDLRHTYAVACIESGVDIKTLQENLGHATASFTLEVYGHVSRQMQLNSATRLETFIQGVYSGKNVPTNAEVVPIL